MPEKPKTRRGASKVEKPKEDQKAQSERFIDAARKVGVDESGVGFSEAIDKIVANKTVIQKASLKDD